MDYLESLKEYLAQVPNAWATLLLGGSSGLIALFAQEVIGISIPSFMWAVLLILTLVAAQFSIFHKVRLQRNRLIHKSPFVDRIDLLTSDSQRSCTLQIRNLGSSAEFYATAQIHTREFGDSLPIKLLWSFGNQLGLRIAHRDWGLIQFISLEIDETNEEENSQAVLPCATISGHKFSLNQMPVLRCRSTRTGPKIEQAAITVWITSDPEVLGGTVEETFYVSFTEDRRGLETKTEHQLLLEKFFGRLRQPIEF